MSAISELECLSPSSTHAATDAMDALQNAQQKQILDVVDSLRSYGLDSILSLPQLVVCGDQSSGEHILNFLEPHEPDSSPRQKLGP